MFRVPARRIAATAALSIAAASTLSWVGAPAASASSDERIDVKYGYVKFEAAGEKLTAGDIWGDGYGVRARLGWETSKGPKTAWVIDTSAGYESTKDLSIREGTTVYLQLCYTRHGADVKCTRSKAAEA